MYNNAKLLTFPAKVAALIFIISGQLTLGKQCASNIDV